MPSPVILVHKSEIPGSTTNPRHIAILKEALPHAEVAIWDGFPPNLKGRDVVKVGNSCFLGSTGFERLAKALRSCKRVFMVIEDYKFPPASQVRHAINGKPNVLLANCPSLLVDNLHLKAWNWAEYCIYVNWNMDSWKLRPFVKPTLAGLVYYGFFRDGRLKDFAKWFNTELYPISLSAKSPRALRKFENAFVTFPPMARYEVMSFEDIQRFPMTIYLEDEKTHTQFHSLANRFYECLSLGIAMVFDEACSQTLAKAGILEEARPWLVSSPKDVARLLPQWASIRKEQRRLWAKDYRAELLVLLKKTFKEEGLL
jgi:hypothetical protein